MTTAVDLYPPFGLRVVAGPLDVFAIGIAPAMLSGALLGLVIGFVAGALTGAMNPDHDLKKVEDHAMRHGNVIATVEVEGTLDQNAYVFDFIELKKRAKAITDELDHHMLLPTRNAFITLEEGPRSVRVRYKDREWVFPRDDCVLLPIENTTAELLARYIATRLRDDLRRHYQYDAHVLRVEVEENVGQSATCELRSG